MSETETRGPGRPATTDVMARAFGTLAESQEAMAAILARLQENQPRKEIGFGDPEYQQRLRDEGYFDDFERPVFQNGRQMEARGLTAETRSRLVRLVPGKYLGGKIEVVLDSRNQRHLIYKSATPEDRMAFAITVGSDMNDIVTKMWAEKPAD